MKKNLKSILSFPPNLFSRYRSELMGIGIIGVLIGHAISLGGITSPFVKTFGIIAHIVFTQGFLLLSGLGLYYSFSKNSDIKQFYNRRVLRLLIPFIIIVTPYFLYCLLFEHHSIFRFLTDITSLSYWYRGNYMGMWYIAVSVLLYALFPYVYRFIFRNHSIFINTLILISLIFLTLIVTKSVFPNYYKSLFGISNIPMFVLGIYFGYLSSHGNKERSLSIFWFIVLWIILFVITKYIWRDEFLLALMVFFERLSLMAIVTKLLDIKNSFVDHLNTLLKWFGKYSLELYILHLMIYEMMETLQDTYGIVTTPYLKVIIMVIGALILCVPVNKFISYLINRFSLLGESILSKSRTT